MRQSKSISAADAATYAREMSALTSTARHAVRDINPRNDLEIFRVRGREREILTAPGPGDAFLAIVIQRWAAAPSDPLTNPSSLMAMPAAAPTASSK